MKTIFSVDWLFLEDERHRDCGRCITEEYPDSTLSMPKLLAEAVLAFRTRPIVLHDNDDDGSGATRCKR